MLALQYILAASAIVSAGCAVFVAVRARRWRETDEWKALVGQVGGLSGGVNALEAAIRGRVTTDQLTEVKGRVSALENEVADLPTKADVARVEGGLSRVESIVIGAARSVDRIEGLLMRQALKDRGEG